MSDNTRIHDEIMELIWTEQETGPVTTQRLLENPDPVITRDQLEAMQRDGYLEAQGGEIKLSPAGTAAAREIIRSHRLAERLMTDILDLGDIYLEKNACVFEHVLSEEVREAVCILLGHPRECPHGRPIPPGPCCQSEMRDVPQVIQSLDNFKSGETGKILYITTKRHDRLDKLAALGLVPGSLFKVHQPRPAFVVKVDETDIAFEKDVAQDIFVRKAAPTPVSNNHNKNET
jgi:DtxR family Mn-dependent transcriptional regulator